MPGPPPSSDLVLALPGGRRLGYAEFGDPGGHPVVNCHGGLVCRLDVAPADEAARRAGVRLLSVDRPGIGRSTRVRGRTIGEWAGDVVAAADRLGLGRFSVLGWSFGGPYAAAVAALRPDRVASAALVAGGVPFAWPCASRGFENRTDKVLLRLSRRCPPLAYGALWATAAVARWAPGAWMRVGAGAMAPRDVAVIERAGVAPFTRAVAEGVRRPGGVVDDYRSYVAPWGFAYEAITVPVAVWQGADDPLVPVAWSEEAARRVPGATLTVVPGCGHFVAWDHWDEILAGLAAAASP